MTQYHTSDSFAEAETDSETHSEAVPLSWMFWRKRRYIVVFMAFLGFFNCYTLRVNLSVAIVTMTEKRPVWYENGTFAYEQYFSWDSTDRGVLLSSFFTGYIFTQVLGGLLGERFGGNLIFGLGIGVSSVMTLLTPIAANMGFWPLCAIRFIVGFFTGVTFPCIHSIWSQWAPPMERSRMATIAFAGSHFGTVIGMSFSGVLAEKFGWASIFYVLGGIGCIWFVLWVLIVKERPAKDKYISQDELEFLQKSLGMAKKIRVEFPWKDVITSKPVYAIVVSQFAEIWGHYTLLTQLPSFLKDTLGFHMEKAGLLSGVPYLAMGVLLGVSGYFADVCQARGFLTTSQVRRYFNCGGFVMQTVFLLGAGYSPSRSLSVVCIVLSVAWGAFAWCGWSVNPLDIAPQHAGVLMGLSNTFATIGGIISPTLTGYIVKNKTIQEWRIVFMIASVIYMIGCIVYWFWASGDVQPWAQSASNETVTEKRRKFQLHTLNV